MKTLIAGANLPLPAADLELTFNYRLTAGELDISAYLLAEKTGKVRGDADMIFYGQKQTPNGAVSFTNGANQAIFRIDTRKIEPQIQKIAICATIDGAANLSVLGHLQFQLRSGGQIVAGATENARQRSEAALILAEIYKHNGAWKCRWVMQGFNGGLRPLAEHFGVEIADEPTSPPPAPEKKINLSKITLDKHNSSVNLEKKAAGFGQIRVNLNWNQNPPAAQKGFFAAFAGNKGIDLDLGAMIRLRDGQIHLVQALGNHFGNLRFPPFTELQGDDRTGAVKDGEWLFINGQSWDQIAQIVVFCFIYEGVPNWAATDGVVRVFIPDQPEIEIKLTEGRNNAGMCGIVELRNERGNIQVRRVVKYFPGHPELDNHFQFGFQWVAARK